jgi:SAM-dependent methyltransferase
MMSTARRVLRSDLAWRLSGLTYPTAVLATHGRIETLTDYLRRCHGQMVSYLAKFPRKAAVLEVGSGLGGNLVSVGARIRQGNGIDVNPHYIRISRWIAARCGVRNLTFSSYDGHTLPSFESNFDVVFSLGLFERLSKDHSRSLLAQMKHRLRPGGLMIHYFLSARARGTPFTSRLGDEAYSFWAESDLRAMSDELGFTLTAQPLMSTGDVFRPEPSFGDVFVMTEKPEGWA